MQERTQATSALEEERRNNTAEQQRLSQAVQAAQAQVESLQQQVIGVTRLQLNGVELSSLYSCRTHLIALV